MQNWKMEQIQRLASEQDPQRMFDQAVELVQALDMPYLGWTFFFNAPGSRPASTQYNNYPSAWNQLYQERLSGLDPIPRACRHCTLPLLWEEALFAQAPSFWQQAHAHGLRHGWTQSQYDLHHHESQLSVARPEGAISAAEFYEKSVHVSWLCKALHTSLATRHLASRQPLPKLSERELEVLKWSAAGKTAADIACILSLSLSTVNFHIRSVIGKTNAANKPAAIAIAMSEGLI